jgi:hypothetical protein
VILGNEAWINAPDLFLVLEEEEEEEEAMTSSSQATTVIIRYQKRTRECVLSIDFQLSL